MSQRMADPRSRKLRSLFVNVLSGAQDNTGKCESYLSKRAANNPIQRFASRNSLPAFMAFMLCNQRYVVTYPSPLSIVCWITYPLQDIIFPQVNRRHPLQSGLL